jgi:hypothetical protein
MSVVSVSVAVEFDANVPLAPTDGAVNVTATLSTGDPPGDNTVACSAANDVPIGTLCGVPPVAVIVSAHGPDDVFVRLKLAGADACGTEAVTV